MRLTVIGASAACPNPGGACSSYLVEQDEFSIVVDCGPGSVPVLRRYAKLRNVDAVLISHLHSDHTIDLVPFRYGLRYIPDGRGTRVPLWLPPGGKEFLDRLESVFSVGPEINEPFFATEFSPTEYDPATSLQVGPFTISFMPTRHFIDCWAMRFDCQGRSLVYLADTSYFEELAEFARDADLLICEATMPRQPADATRSDGHLTASDAGRLATLAGAEHLLLTHMWEENSVVEAAKDARAMFEGAITIADSGVRIQI